MSDRAHNDVTAAVCGRQVADLMKMLKTVHAEKLRQRRTEMRLRAAKHQKQQAKLQAKRDRNTKDMKKRMYAIQGKMEAAAKRGSSSR